LPSCGTILLQGNKMSCLWQGHQQT
jgi:hypothetical protein